MHCRIHCESRPLVEVSSHRLPWHLRIVVRAYIGGGCFGLVEANAYRRFSVEGFYESRDVWAADVADGPDECFVEWFLLHKCKDSVFSVGRFEIIDKGSNFM